ncbi:9550_t:CDS:2, partial [Funneliformis geosporum]
KITGTVEQRKIAVRLLQDTLGRSNSFSPPLGFTLLNVSDEYESRYIGTDFKAISFEKVLIDHQTNDSIPYKNYTLVINNLSTCPSTPSTSATPIFSSNKRETHLNCKNCNSSEFSINNLSGKIYKFTTIQLLEICLSKVLNATSCEQQVSDEEFRLKVCFGKVFFNKLDKTALSLCEWNGLQRGHKGITTSFCHDVGSFEDAFKIERLNNAFGFRRADLVEENVITISFTESNEKKKLKLYYDQSLDSWKIKKVTKNFQRHAIIDIISGNETSNLRFIIKSQVMIPISNKYSMIIDNLQKSNRFLGRMYLMSGKVPLQLDCFKMFIRQDDFALNNNFKCTRVRQSIIKKRFINESYQLNFISTLQDEEGRVSSEDTINLIHKSWIPPSSSERSSVSETINFARKLTGMI